MIAGSWANQIVMNTTRRANGIIPARDVTRNRNRWAFHRHVGNDSGCAFMKIGGPAQRQRLVCRTFIENAGAEPALCLNEKADAQLSFTATACPPIRITLAKSVSHNNS